MSSGDAVELYTVKDALEHRIILAVALFGIQSLPCVCGGESLEEVKCIRVIYVTHQFRLCSLSYHWWQLEHVTHEHHLLTAEWCELRNT